VAKSNKCNVARTVGNGVGAPVTTGVGLLVNTTGVGNGVGRGVGGGVGNGYAIWCKQNKPTHTNDRRYSGRWRLTLRRRERAEGKRLGADERALRAVAGRAALHAAPLAAARCDQRIGALAAHRELDAVGRCRRRRRRRWHRCRLTSGVFVHRLALCCSCCSCCCLRAEWGTAWGTASGSASAAASAVEDCYKQRRGGGGEKNLRSASESASEPELAALASATASAVYQYCCERYTQQMHTGNTQTNRRRGHGRGQGRRQGRRRERRTRLLQIERNRVGKRLRTGKRVAAGLTRANQILAVLIVAPVAARRACNCRVDALIAASVGRARLLLRRRRERRRQRLLLLLLKVSF
jgi:hypothetical protein